MVDKDEFKVSDKRASHDDDEDTASVPGPVPPATPPVDAGPHLEEETPFGPEDEPPVSILELNFFETTNFFLGILIQKAWISLGLVGNPATGKMERDAQEARRLIDMISLIAEHLKGKWEHPMLEAELQTQLTNLRLNFAKLAPTP